MECENIGRMNEEVNAEMLKICWTPVGFTVAGSHCAVKFHIQAKELHTMLTDYQHVFYEKAMLAKKFTSLNAKLGGPELALLVKIRTMFLSPTSKVSNEKKGNEMMEFDLEALSGKRTLKWHFAGRLLDESGLYVFLHVTRPLMNMLSAAVEKCDLSSIHGHNSGTGFNDLFGKPLVQQLYEAVATKPKAKRNADVARDDSDNDDDNSDDNDGEENANSGGGGDKDDSDSLPATPPPCGSEGNEGDGDSLPPTPEPTNNTSQENEEEVREVRKSPQKKPRLRF